MPPVTFDIPWSGDFALDDRGRIVLTDENTAYVHRIIRRLLTTPRIKDAVSGHYIIPPDYLAEPDFGIGLRRKVLSTVNKTELKRLIYNQVGADPETSKAALPDIIIEVRKDGTCLIGIKVIREPNTTLAFGFVIPRGGV